MLLSVEITNFRSCENVRIDDIGSVLVLVGRNGVGKTNILCAIEWAAKIATMTKPLEWSPLEVNQQSNVTLRFKLDGRTFKYTAAIEDLTLKMRDVDDARLNRTEKLEEEFSSGEKEVLFHLNEGKLLSLEDSMRISAGSPAISSIFSLIPDSPILPTLKRISEFLSSVKYYPLTEHEPTQPESTIFISETELNEWRKGKSARPSSAMHLKILTLQQQNPSRFEELCQILGPDGLNVVNHISVVSFEVPVGLDGKTPAEQKKTTYHLVRFAPSNFSNSNLFHFSNLSFGTRRVVRLVTSLIYDASSVFLLEQPEDGIHAGLLHKLLPLLRSYSDETQMIVSTHSAHILNRVDPTEVRLIDMVDETTKARALNGAEILGAQEYMSQDGPLSEFIESVQE
jgi:energy-coupling factor transporter ATP-binding protein EcfA2